MKTTFSPAGSRHPNILALHWRLGTGRMLRRFVLLLLTIPLAAQAQFNYSKKNGAITITGFSGGCAAGPATIPSAINGLPVTTLGELAFEGCTGLTSVMSGNSVTTLGDEAFLGCTGLKAIEVEALNPAYSSLDGVLFSKDRTTLFQYPKGKAGNYTLPNSVTAIWHSAFAGCTGLTSVTLPNSVTTIGDGAFGGCTGLTSVMIGNSVTTIGDGAFYGCTGLTNVSLPNSVSTIGVRAFAACPRLTSVTIPNSVTTLGDLAFEDCTGLANVMIGNSVTTPLGTGWFLNCTGLKAIEVKALNPAYSSLDGVLFSKDRTTLFVYPQGKAGNYTLPNGVTAIRHYAFQSCTSLTSVTLPNSVTTLGVFAFAYCTSLTSVYFQGNAPAYDAVLFDTVFRDASRVTAYYLAGAAGWGATFAGRPTRIWSSPLILSQGPGLGAGTDGFGFRIFWAPNAPVVVEAGTDLANPAWLPVGTNTPSSGTSQFSDPQWTNHPARFYRLRTP